MKPTIVKIKINFRTEAVKLESDVEIFKRILGIRQQYRTISFSK